MRTYSRGAVRFASQAALLSLLVGHGLATHANDNDNDMSVPTSVEAGATVTATMSATLVDSNINLDSYLQVYLAASYDKVDLLSTLNLGKHGWQPQCMVTQYLDPCKTAGISLSPGKLVLDNAEIAYTLPADIGPSGAYYSLQLQVMPGGEEGMYLPIKSLTSNAFSMSGCSGVFSDLLQLNKPVPEPGWYPCGSYGCVVQCQNKYGDKNGGYYQKNLGKGEKGEKYWECAKQCSGVSTETTTIKGHGTTCTVTKTEQPPQPDKTTITKTEGQPPPQKTTIVQTQPPQTVTAAPPPPPPAAAPPPPPPPPPAPAPPVSESITSTRTVFVTETPTTFPTQRTTPPPVQATTTPTVVVTAGAPAAVEGAAWMGMGLWAGLGAMALF